MADFSSYSHRCQKCGSGTNCVHDFFGSELSIEKDDQPMLGGWGLMKNKISPTHSPMCSKSFCCYFFKEYFAMFTLFEHIKYIR